MHHSAGALHHKRVYKRRASMHACGPHRSTSLPEYLSILLAPSFHTTRGTPERGANVHACKPILTGVPACMHANPVGLERVNCKVWVHASLQICCKGQPCQHACVLKLWVTNRAYMRAYLPMGACVHACMRADSAQRACMHACQSCEPQARMWTHACPASSCMSSGTR